MLQGSRWFLRPAVGVHSGIRSAPGKVKQARTGNSITSHVQPCAYPCTESRRAVDTGAVVGGRTVRHRVCAAWGAGRGGWGGGGIGQVGNLHHRWGANGTVGEAGRRAGAVGGSSGVGVRYGIHRVVRRCQVKLVIGIRHAYDQRHRVQIRMSRGGGSGAHSGKVRGSKCSGRAVISQR